MLSRQGGGGGRAWGWGFDIFEKFAVKFPAHGQIIPVKCNQISLHIAVKYPKAGPIKGTIEISPNKTLQSLFLNVVHHNNINTLELFYTRKAEYAVHNILIL